MRQDGTATGGQQQQHEIQGNLHLHNSTPTASAGQELRVEEMEHEYATPHHHTSRTTNAHTKLLESSRDAPALKGTRTTQRSAQDPAYSPHTKTLKQSTAIPFAVYDPR